MFGGIPVAEIEKLHEYWQAFPTLKEALFTKSDTPYVSVATDDIKQTIQIIPILLPLKRICGCI